MTTKKTLLLAAGGAAAVFFFLKWKREADARSRLLEPVPPGTSQTVRGGTGAVQQLNFDVAGPLTQEAYDPTTYGGIGPLPW